MCDKVWVTKIKQQYDCDLTFTYDYSAKFKPAKIIEEDDELQICLYEKLGKNEFMLTDDGHSQ